MAKIVFYMKPGCGNNKKQRDFLQLGGHDVEESDILSQEWTRPELE